MNPITSLGLVNLIPRFDPWEVLHMEVKISILSSVAYSKKERAANAVMHRPLALILFAAPVKVEVSLAAAPVYEAVPEVVMVPFPGSPDALPIWPVEDCGELLSPGIPAFGTLLAVGHGTVIAVI